MTFLFTTICPSAVNTSSPRRRLESGELESPNSKNSDRTALIWSGTAGDEGHTVWENAIVLAMVLESVYSRSNWEKECKTGYMEIESNNQRFNSVLCSGRDGLGVARRSRSHSRAILYHLMHALHGSSRSTDLVLICVVS